MGDDLREVLEEARSQGFLGDGPVEAHVAHARAWAELLEPPGRFLDLGSGAGVPGLVLALAWPGAEGTLLDSQGRRTAWLASAVERLGLSPRVGIVTARAEEAARDPSLREGFSLVVARSFGSPAVTAECAVGFLHENGRLAVSDPPEGESVGRWPSEGLAKLGLSGAEVARGPGVTLAVIRRVGELDERWPRRVGVPGKRPLW